MQATTAPGSSSGEFVDKTDLAPGTKWTAADANAWQAELLHVITEAGLTPSGSDLEQIRKGIQALAKLVKVDEATNADHADAAPLPIGATYIQFPGKIAPSTLWPGTTWSNISSSFAGDFFRAEGGSASAFESGEQSGLVGPHVHTIPTYTGSGGVNGAQFGVNNGPAIVSTNANTGSETRPINRTIRIWERTA